MTLKNSISTIDFNTHNKSATQLPVTYGPSFAISHLQVLTKTTLFFEIMDENLMNTFLLNLLMTKLLPSKVSVSLR